MAEIFYMKHLNIYANIWKTNVLPPFIAADIDSRLEEQLIDGILYAFQEQTTEVR